MTGERYDAVNGLIQVASVRSVDTLHRGERDRRLHSVVWIVSCIGCCVSQGEQSYVNSDRKLAKNLKFRYWLQHTIIL